VHLWIYERVKSISGPNGADTQSHSAFTACANSPLYLLAHRSILPSHDTSDKIGRSYLFSTLAPPSTLLLRFPCLAMLPYILIKPTAFDVPRLAEIQQAAFMNEPVTLGAHANVSKEDYISWASKVISRAHAPPGCEVEFVCAKDAETGEIVGWAEWAMPLDEGEEPKEGGEKEKDTVSRGRK
jgi:hypothetical protein